MKKRKISFLEGKAFYAVLFLCLAAVGIAGYVIFFGEKEKIQTVAVEDQSTVFRDTFLDEVLAEASEKEDESATAEKSEPPETQVSAELQWVAPLEGSVIKSFSGNDLVYSETMGDWRTHNGVDLQAETGSEVRAITKGVVTGITNDSLDGISVTVQHALGYKAVYKNLEDSLPCKVGDEIEAGDIIGRVGNTMATESTGQSHLHLEVIKDGGFVDPVTLFKNTEKH